MEAGSEPCPIDNIFDIDFDNVPKGQGPYPKEVDERVRLFLDRCLAGSEASSLEPEALFGIVGAQLRDYPGHRFLAVADESGYVGELDKRLSPRAEEALVGYADGEYGFNLEPYWLTLDKRERLIMSLLLAKDAGTAEHCCDALVISLSFLHAIENELGINFSADERLHLILASFKHDVGKLSVPALVLCNVFQREHLPRIYHANVIDHHRKRALNAPGELTPEEADEFRDVLDPQSVMSVLDPDFLNKAERLVKILKEGKCDFRDLIPIRFMLKVSRDMTEDGKFPNYVPSLEEGDQTPFKDEALKTLAEHKGALKRLELILDLAGIDGWQTSFRSALERHEAAGISMLHPSMGPESGVQAYGSRPIRIATPKALPAVSLQKHHLGVLTLVGHHHGYNSTRQDPAYGLISQFPDSTRMLVQILKIVDIVCALAQHRSYKPGRSADVVWRILGDEARKAGIDSKLLKIVEPLILSGNAGVGDVLRGVRENVGRTYGGVSFNLPAEVRIGV